MYVKLDHGPDPERAERRGLLHDGVVAVLVTGVDKVTPSCDTAYEEEELVECWLVFGRESRKEDWGGGMRVEEVEEEENNWFH